VLYILDDGRYHPYSNYILSDKNLNARATIFYEKLPIVHGKNDFTEGSKVLLDINKKNNFVGPSK